MDRSLRRGLIMALVLLGLAAAVCEAGSPAQQVKPRIAGIWNVRVEGLSMWAPHYTLDKSVGMISWKIWLDGSRLSIAEYEPSFDYTLPPNGDLSRAPFKPLKLTDVVVDQKRVTFKVLGVYGAFEKYQLDYFTESEIRGGYYVYDRYGGAPGYGPEYQGTLILTKEE